MAGQSPIARAWARASLVLILLATLTPQEGSSSLRQGFFAPPLLDASSTQLDSLQNILLYVPLGLALGLSATSWIRTLFTAFAVSLATELCQFAVPGRDPVATDVLLNVCGAALARVVAPTPVGIPARALLLTSERWLTVALSPDRRAASMLSIVWAAVAGLVIGLTCWLLSPALPGPFYYLVTTPLMDDARGPVRIGSDGDQQTFFNGLIDEVRIYSRDRTPEEIRNDMQTALSASSRDEDLVAAYGFDSSQEIASDDAGRGHHAAVRGAVWTPAGRFGGALSFDGRTSQVVVPPFEAFHLRQAVTVEAWVKPAGAQSSRAPIVVSPRNGYFLRASSSSGALAPSGGATFGEYLREARVRRRLPVNQWTHFAMTYDGQTIALYVDGLPSVRLRHWSTHHPVNASIDGVDLPAGPVPSPTRLHSLLSGRFTLNVTLKCGPLVPQAAPAFALVGVQSREVLTLDVSRSELRVRPASKARRARLVPVDLRVPDALSGCAPGETRSVVVKGPLSNLRIEDSEGRTMPNWGPGVGSLWAFLIDSRFIPTRLLPAVSAGYLALLALPFGFWARFGLPTVAGGLLLAGTLALAPSVWGTPPVDRSQAGGIATGVLLGVALSRTAAHQHGLDRLEDDEHVEGD